MGFLRTFFAAALASLVLAGPAVATVYTAASCSAAAVQSAMNSATSSGDEVRIPAGTCHWSTQVTWNAPKNAVLSGAGSTAITGGNDVTIIIDDYGTNAPLLVLNLDSASDGHFTMYGWTLQGGSGIGVDNGVITFTGGNLRIHHFHYNSFTYSPAHSGKAILLNNNVFGVMDHCILDFHGTTAIYVQNGPGADGKGNATWAADTNFGGSNFFFIEDNIVNGTPASHDTRISDGWSAGRSVARFNSLTAAAGAELHATGHAGDDRGYRASEYYGNTGAFGAGQPGTYEPNFDLADASSGPTLIWNNSAPNIYKNGIIFNVTRKDNGTYTQPATPTGWGYCGTAFNGTGSNWDQNTVANLGYACIDQPGRGRGDLLVGSFPTKTNNTTGTIAWPNQALEPIYIWMNDAAVAPGWGGAFYSNSSSGRVISDKDYYPQASGIQSNSTTPFNGTTGTGWGTLANRPTTCTTGVGYFATDQGSWNTSTSNPYGVQMNGADGVLYKCTATNTWALYYTPYTYPHPYQGGGSSLSAPVLDKWRPR